MNNLMQDIRYAVRLLRQRPVHAAIIIGTLALGIGLNTAVFSVVNSMLLKPLPFPDHHQLVALWITNPELKKMGLDRMPLNYPTFADWQNHMVSCQSLGGFQDGQMNFKAGGDPERVRSSSLTSGFFETLGVRPFWGRHFLPEEYRPGKTQAVILGHALWQRHFGQRRDVLGQTVQLDGTLYTVVGIMPADFKFRWENNVADLWIPLAPNPAQADGRSWFLNVVARLKPRVSLEQTRTEIRILGDRLQKQYPKEMKDCTVEVERFQEALFGNKRPALLILLAAVGFVMLIACANIGNMMLAQSIRREQEFAIRVSLGAAQGRILRQLVTESLLLGWLGGGIGVLLAGWTSNFIYGFFLETRFVIPEIRQDFRVLAFAFLLSLATGVASGLFPALQLKRINLGMALKQGSRSVSWTREKHRLSGLLVMGEVSMTLMLLVGAGLMVRSFLHLLRVPLGFQAERVLTLSVPLLPTQYPNDQKQRAFFQQLLTRIQGLPGVRSAAVSSSYPMIEGVEKWGFQIEGVDSASLPKPPDANLTNTSPAFFSVFGIPLRRGRFFSEQDNEKGAPVVIINETLARTWWKDQDPIGKRIKADETWRTIVGVVGDVRQTGIKDAMVGEMYMPYLQFPLFNMHLLAATNPDPLTMVGSIRREVQILDPNLPVAGIRTMKKVLAGNIAEDHLNLLLLGTFGFFALILATVGIYGVLAHEVSRRTREMGIRMALGARVSQVLQMILRQGMRQVLIGMGLGLAGSIILTRFLRGLLFGVKPIDSFTFFLVLTLFFLAALVACYLPAHRAASVDPMVALRQD